MNCQDKYAIVLGASDGLGKQLCYALSTQGVTPIMLARSVDVMEAIAQDIYASFGIQPLVKALDLSHHQAVFVSQLNDVFSAELNICQLFVTAVTMEEGDDVDLSGDATERLFKVNTIRTIRFIQAYKQFVEANGISGKVAIASSIAVPVPRNRNAIYTATKVALESYVNSMQIANNDQFRVKLFRIGFMKTKLFKKTEYDYLATEPQKVAKKMIQSIHARGRLVYVPGFWRLVVFVLKITPWFIYRKLKF